MSSAIALRAAYWISSGAAKSGKPWQRLTALCFSASRVISRITDSVNCSALAESMRRASCVMDSGAVIGLRLRVYGRTQKKQRERTTQHKVQRRDAENAEPRRGEMICGA